MASTRPALRPERSDERFWRSYAPAARSAPPNACSTCTAPSDSPAVDASVLSLSRPLRTSTRICLLNVAPANATSGTIANDSSVSRQSIHSIAMSVPKITSSAAAPSSRLPTSSSFMSTMSPVSRISRSPCFWLLWNSGGSRIRCRNRSRLSLAMIVWPTFDMITVSLKSASPPITEMIRIAVAVMSRIISGE